MRVAAGRTPRLGMAWLALSAAVALHVIDEALTGFLSVFNPTMMVLKQRFPWAPFPAFRYDVWLGGLVIGIVVLFALTPLFFRGGAGVRWPAYVFAVLMVGNGLGHTLATIFGRTVPQVTFSRPAPGFYSSPFLIAAAVWVITELRRSSAAL